MASASTRIELIVGLGNPGPQYETTRHNAGFWFVDELAAKYAASFVKENRFFGEVSKFKIDGQDVRLLKPGTFMNRSGQAIAALSNYFKIPAEHILVAHDELDLPAGTLRLKRGGGHGGHNGLRDTLAHLNNKDFWRLRIGIGHPGHKDRVLDYVLHRASAAEQADIDQAIQRSINERQLILSGDMEKAMHILHSA